jgi:hypothetical protein
MSTPDEHLNAVSIEGAPEEKGAAHWYEQYRQQREETERLRTQINQMAVEIEQLKETLKKITNRNSKNSSQPPSADAHKKPSKAIKQRKKKQGPKYGHPGTTRNGLERVDQCIELGLELCPVCGKPLARVDGAPWRRHQIAELVSQPVEVTESVRPAYRCLIHVGTQGFLADSIMFLSDVALAVLLFVLLKPVNKTLALIALCFRLTQLTSATLLIARRPCRPAG